MTIHGSSNDEKCGFRPYSNGVLKTLGIETGLQALVLLAAMTLVLITPLGGSGGAPTVFFIYRSTLLLLIILCAIGCKSMDFRIHRTFMALLIAAFTLMFLSVLRVEGSRFVAFYLLYRHTFFIGAFVGLACYARYQSAAWKGTLLGTVVASCLGHLIPELTKHGQIAGFSTNNANYFGTYLLVGLAASLAVALFGRRPDWRTAAGLTAAVLFFGISRTWSRGALLAAGAMIAVAAYRAGSRIPRRVWIGTAIVAVTLVVVSSPYVVRKFLDRGERDPYNYARAQVWLNSLPLIVSNPILGVGPGQYIHESKRFAFPVEGQVARFLKRAQMAHSEYLQHIAEVGIPATMILLSLFGYAIYLSWKRSETVWPEYRCFNEAAILTAIGVGTHALVDNCWTIPVSAASIVVIALADVVPLENRSIIHGSLWSRKSILAAATGLVIMLYVHSVVIPGIGLYYNDRGHEAYLRVDYPAAERFHLAALRYVPNHSLFLDNLGMVYFQQFTETRQQPLLELGRQYFTRASNAAPLSLDPLIHLETVYLQSFTGDPQHDGEIYKALVNCDEHLLAIDPYLPFPRKNLAAALYQLGQRDRAIEELKKALEFEPNYVPGYLEMAAWYHDAGNESESQLYQKAAISIVTKYQSFKPHLAYEGLLLGRPADTLPKN